jgi:hypothetical protein
MNTLETNVFIGVIAAAIWAALVSTATFAGYRVGLLLRNRKAGALWGSFMKDTVIVIGVSPYEGNYSWEPSGLIGAGDVHAMMSLSEHLLKLHSDPYSVKTPDQLVDADWHKNMILIGGPSSNVVVSDLIPKVTRSIYFPNRSPDEITLIHNGRPDDLDADWSPGRWEKRSNDYGVILFGNNPRARGKKLLFLAGGSGFGSRLAAERVTNSDFLAQELPRQGSAFVETFKLSFIRGVATQPQEPVMTSL